MLLRPCTHCDLKLFSTQYPYCHSLVFRWDFESEAGLAFSSALCVRNEKREQ